MEGAVEKGLTLVKLTELKEHDLELYIEARNEFSQSLKDEE